jgi:hypothetical protein
MNSAATATDILTVTRYFVVRESDGFAVSQPIDSYYEAASHARHMTGGRHKVESRELPISIPSRWGMFSSSGNRAITAYASALVKAAAKIKDDRSLSERARTKKVDAALVTYIAKWERLCANSKHIEAGDTAVRKAIGAFHDKVREAVTGDSFASRDAWERNRSAAYRRVRKAS